MSDPIIIGRIGTAYAVRGWVKIHPFTQPPEQLFAYEHLLIESKSKHWQPLIIEQWKAHGNKQHIAKIQGIDDRDAALRLTNADIAIANEELPTLDDNEFYWKDLIGCEVFTENHVRLGVVKRLEPTPAQDVMEVMGERIRYIPFNKDVVKNVDLQQRRVMVDWDLDI